MGLVLLLEVWWSGGLAVLARRCARWVFGVLGERDTTVSREAGVGLGVSREHTVVSNEALTGLDVRRVASSDGAVQVLPALASPAVANHDLLALQTGAAGTHPPPLHVNG